MKTTRVLLTIAAMAAMASAAHAAFIVEAVGGLASGTNFAFGADTTAASTSIPSQAVGLTSTNSYFGGNGSNSAFAAFNAATADTYVFSYTPGSDTDNFSPTAGSLLGSTAGFGTETASGVAGGASGTYKVYITAPESTNVASTSQITVTGDGAPVFIPAFDFNNGGSGADQNPGVGFAGGANNAWALIGTVDLTAGSTYTVSVVANANFTVSQRVHGVMWELQPGARIPEPSSIGIAALAMLGTLAVVRRRR